ncbi:DUF6515 family protein [Ichthyenterobacterium sp. W332]|uniref:DUF6515 family protein n=1 Tax=Microcosmobacter mediterraneus TaxID=3075607 RepID=A0ABU2YM10_9FLAO|nr:DUF6515 family protein [Ichthyenterobacterium sp. W332]MDT0558103.1 DUF6515 family protein [Ichthyenterobacterium sp. W332]
MRTLIIILGTVCVISLNSCATRVRTTNAQVTIVKKRPAHYKIVKVKGKRYYFWNGRHYQKTKRGYVVVRV